MNLMQAKLDEGGIWLGDVFFTLGLYDVSKTLEVKRANSVILGSGHATLAAVGGTNVMQVADVAGVVIAGLTIDAGPVESQVLLQLGAPNGQGSSDATNPTTLSDVYFRIGGPPIGKAVTTVEVNSDKVLIDHIWVCVQARTTPYTAAGPTCSARTARPITRRTGSRCRRHPACNCTTF